MASLRYILPALSIAGGAAAASCSVDSTTTLQNSGDASAIASCTTFSGSVAIATGTSENIDLSGIQSITGDLTADSVRNLPGVISSSLQSIGGTFSLQNLTVLSTLNFPTLSKVGTIDWNGLPALQQLTFTGGVKMANSVSIQNTQLGALTGINLDTVGNFTLANNGYLTAVDMATLSNITNSITISANGLNVAANFPQLIWANNLDLSNISSFSAPALSSVNQSLSLRSSYFTSLAGPNVTMIGQNLVVVDCPQLNNLSFPVLKSLGAALTVANNSALKSINSFPQLATIQGAVDFTGNFTNASLPAITNVRGSFNVQSQSDLTATCATFSKLTGSGSNIVQGTYYCSGTIADPTTSGTPSTSGSSSSKTSTAAASPMQLPVATGLLGVVAAIFGLL